MRGKLKKGDFISLVVILIVIGAVFLLYNNSTINLTGFQAGTQTQPENVQRVKQVLPETTWNDIFPMANSVYTYDEFIKAIERFPVICSEAADPNADLNEICKKELATIFAHATQETGAHDPSSPTPEWKQGLYYITELGCSDTNPGCDYRGGSCTDGTWQAYAYPCPDGVKYYGRGAKQLSYNYNYGLFSRFMFDSPHVLLKEPNKVATEGWLAVSSALWFYTTPQPPKPSMHDVVVGKWQPNAADTTANINSGFGATINIINGGIECGGTVEHAQAQNRINYYNQFCTAFVVPPGNNLGCTLQQTFPATGSGAQPIYWEQDWAQPGACKLVSYQTSFMNFFDEDYDRCVAYHFGGTTQCNDNIDNDNDGQTDYPNDPECDVPVDDNETAPITSTQTTPISFSQTSVSINNNIYKIDTELIPDQPIDPNTALLIEITIKNSTDIVYTDYLIKSTSTDYYIELPSTIFKDGQYSIDLLLDDQGYYANGTGLANFTKDTTAPQVTDIIIDPDPVRFGYNTNITFEVTDEDSVNSVFFFIKQGTQIYTTHRLLPIGSDRFSYPYHANKLDPQTFKTLNTGKYNLTVEAHDEAGNILKEVLRKVEVNQTHIRFSETPIITPTCGDNICDPEENTTNCPSDCKTPTITVFKKPLFNSVLPNSTPQTNEIIDTVSISASPGEYEPGTFVIHTTQDLTDVTVTATDLTGSEGSISKDNIDIRIVKVWKQGGLSVYVDEPQGILVPELLLYDDEQVLTGGFIGQLPYQAPTISTTLRTNISKDTSKQFWITVKLPEDATPGKYTSNLQLSSKNSNKSDIKLDVTVLPIKLQKPKQMFGIYYSPYNPYDRARIYSDELIEKQLIDLREHGFNTITLGTGFAGTDDQLDKLVQTAKNLGFDGQIIVGMSETDKIIEGKSESNLQNKIDTLNKYGYEPYVYGWDEPNLINPPTPRHSVAIHIRRSRNIHQADGKVATAIKRLTTQRLRLPESAVFDTIDPATEPDNPQTFREQGITPEPIDHAIYPLCEEYDDPTIACQRVWIYIHGLRNGYPREPFELESYYWQLYQEKPKLNRLLSGFFLWTTQLDGIMAHHYRVVPDYDRTLDPFNDFDSKKVQGLYGRDWMVTYPSSQGPIPTTKWEAMREGYDDVRYLTTLFNLTKKLNSSNPTKAQQIESEINNELQKYYNPKVYVNLTGDDFQATRDIIISKILEVQDELPTEQPPEDTSCFFKPFTDIAVDPYPDTLEKIQHDYKYSTDYPATKKLPSEWINEWEAKAKAKGWQTKWFFTDTLGFCNPQNNYREYILKINDDSALSEPEWVKQAFSGRVFPAPIKPFEDLKFGVMHYSGNIDLAIAAKYNVNWTDAYKLPNYNEEYIYFLDQHLKEIKGKGADSVVFASQAPSNLASDTVKTFKDNNLNLIYFSTWAYFNPEKYEADKWNNIFRPQRLQGALSLLDEFYNSGYTDPLLGFEVKEEIWPEYVSAMDEFYKELRDKHPDFPLYTLHNKDKSMRNVTLLPQHIWGTDMYRFISAIFVSFDRQPSPFLYFYPPQKGLTNTDKHFNIRYTEPMRLGTVFTFTPNTVRTEDYIFKDQHSPENISKIENLLPLPGMRANDSCNTYSLITRYAPPKNAMRALIWLSIAYGAQGWYPWYYTPTIQNLTEIKRPNCPQSMEEDYNAYTNYVRRNGGFNVYNETWDDYFNTANDLEKFEDIILNLRPDGFPRVKIEDPLLIGKTLRVLPSNKSHVITLVNIDVGRWRYYNGPFRINTGTRWVRDIDDEHPQGLSLDTDWEGRLLGFQPLTEPRTVQFELRVADDEIVYDLKTAQKLTKISSNDSLSKYETSINPGDGALIFVGPEEELSLLSAPAKTICNNNGICETSENTTNCPTDCEKIIYDIKQDFGAVGDGITDDYNAFVAAAKAINNSENITLYLPEGDYLINQHVIKGPNANGIHHLKWDNCKNFRLQGAGIGKTKISFNGSFDRSADYGFVDRGGQTYALSYHTAPTLFYFNDCHNFIIDGFEIDGNVDQTTRETESAIVYEDFSHGIAVGSSSNYVISNMYIHHMQTDGIYLGRGIIIPTLGYRIADKNATLINVSSSNNARLNLAIIQLKGGKFINSRFEEGGRTGIYGTHSPSSGVDIEPNRFTPDMDVNTGDLVFENCIFNNSLVHQIVTGYDIDNLVIRNSEIYMGESNSTPARIRMGNITIENSFIDTGKNWVFLARNNESCKSELARGETSVIRNTTFISYERGLWAHPYYYYNCPLIIENSYFTTEGSLSPFNQALIGAKTLMQPRVVGENVIFRNNHIFRPAKWYSKTSGGEAAVILNVNLSKNNTFSTNLTGNKHYFTSYDYDSKFINLTPIVFNDKYLQKENFRPYEDYIWPSGSDGAYSQGFICGNSICENTENQTNCPSDCKNLIGENDLIAWYSFDALDRNTTHVFDLSGNGFHGELKNNIGFSGGLRGDALSLDGINDYVSLPDISDPDMFGGFNGSLTVGALVNVDDTSRINTICGGCGPFSYFSFGFTDNPKLISQVFDHTSHSNYWPDSLSLLKSDQWTYVFFVFNGSQGSKYYINGRLTDEVSRASIGLWDYGGSSIGCLLGYGHCLGGLMDEVMIWNRSLSSEEILNLSSNLSLCGDAICNGAENANTCSVDCLNFTFGCTNTPSSSCIDFGSVDDINGPISVSPVSHLSKKSNEGNIKYRNIILKQHIDIGYPAFNNDRSGFPLSPMVLEVRYKDVYHDSSGSYTGFITNRIVVKSLANFSNKHFEIAPLEGSKTDEWITKQIFFSKPPWPMIKVVNGSYSFQIDLNDNGNVVSLPIDYVALHAISQSEYDKWNQYENDIRGILRVDKVRSANFSGLAWFSKSSSEPIYEVTVPYIDEINRSISKRTALNEVLIIPLSIVSSKDINNVTLSLNSLSGATGVLSSKVNVFEVIQDLKAWQYNKKYGLMPDRIEPFDSTKISGNKTKTFWFVLFINESQSGNYRGDISVFTNSVRLFDVPIRIEVMPFHLNEPFYSSFIYADPDLKPYSVNNNKVYNNLADHSLSPKSTFGNTETDVMITKKGIGNCTKILCYNLSGYESRLDKLAEHKLLTSKHFVYIYSSFPNTILRELGISEGTYYEKLSDDLFVQAYSLLIEELNSIAKSKNTEFIYTVIDEPGVDELKRIVADRIFRIIKDTGSKTWVTYYPECENEVIVATIRAPIGTVIPGLGPLLDYKIYAMRHITSSDISSDSDKFGYYTTYYSQLRNPIYNRFLHGAWAYRTKTNVIGIYAYGDYIGDPYNDFDPSRYHKFPSTANDFLLAYPTWSGEMTSTMGLEGLREGITDARYLATLQKLMQDNPGPIADEANTFLNDSFSSLGMNWNIDYVNTAGKYGFDNIILTQLSGDSTDYDIFDRLRDNISDYILRVSPCNNGVCDPGETTTNCPSDCQTTPVCGNNICDQNENQTICPSDCPITTTCGDGNCDSNETCTNCASDCGACPAPPSTSTGGGGGGSSRRSRSSTTTETKHISHSLDSSNLEVNIDENTIVELESSGYSARLSLIKTSEQTATLLFSNPSSNNQIILTPGNKVNQEISVDGLDDVVIYLDSIDEGDVKVKISKVTKARQMFRPQDNIQETEVDIDAFAEKGEDIEVLVSTTGTCFDDIKNNGEEQPDCGGPCSPCKYEWDLRSYFSIYTLIVFSLIAFSSLIILFRKKHVKKSHSENVNEHITRLFQQGYSLTRIRSHLIEHNYKPDKADLFIRNFEDKSLGRKYLEKYMEKNLKDGHPIENIKQALLTAGYNPELVDKIIKKIT